MHSRSVIGAAFLLSGYSLQAHFSQKYQFDALGLCKLELGQIDTIKNRTTAELSPKGKNYLLSD